MNTRRRVLWRVPLFFLALFVAGLALYALALLFSDSSPVSLHKETLFAFFTQYAGWIVTFYTIFIACVLFLENRNPDRTISWLLVLALLPGIGLILYWVVGPNFKYLAGRFRFRLPELRNRAARPLSASTDTLSQDTAALIYRSSGSPVLTGKEITMFTNGEATFTAIFTEIAKAEKSVLLATYILRNDTLGNRLKDILIAKAQAGVTVCLLYDAVGSWKIGQEYVSELRNAGVHAYPFLPAAFPMFRGANYRNHRKITIIDTATAFTGGFNFGDEYLGKSKKFGYWRDTHVMLRGDAAKALADIILKDFHLAGAPADILESVKQNDLNFPPAQGDDVPIQIAASGPDTAWDTIHKAYFSLISRARKRVWITTPYLVPGDALMNALCSTALSGIDVRVLIPAKIDSYLVHWASLRSCEELLRAGVRVYLYRTDRFIHAKTITCDGSVMSIGSANFDTRSLQINFEVQSFIYDEAIAAQGETQFQEDIANAQELQFFIWIQRPLIKKIQENIGKLFSSLV